MALNGVCRQIAIRILVSIGKFVCLVTLACLVTFSKGWQ